MRAGGNSRRFVADRQDMVGLGLAARRAEDALGELARGVNLEMQAGAAVEELHEQLGLCAVFLRVRPAEEILRVTCEQLHEVVRRRIETDAHLRDARGSWEPGVGR